MSANLSLRLINNDLPSTFLSRSLHGWLPQGWSWTDADRALDPEAPEILVFGAPDYRSLRRDFAMEEGSRLLGQLSPGHRTKLLEGRAVLLVDMTNEAPAASEIGAEALLEDLTALGIAPDRVYLASMNAGLSHEVHPLGFRSFLVDSFALEIAHRLQSTDEGRQHQELEWVTARKSFDQPFLCLNATPRAPRVALVAALMSDGLLEGNYVSWGGWEHVKAREVIAGTAEAAKSLLAEWMPEVEPWVDRVMDLAPIRFDAPEQHGNELSYSIPWIAYGASSYSIVTEPTVTRAHWRITEKSVKALAAGHMPVILGHRRTYDLLAVYGFSPPSPGLLAAHDLADTPGERLRLIRDTWRMLAHDSGDRLAELRPLMLANMQFARTELLQHLRASMVQPILDQAAADL